MALGYTKNARGLMIDWIDGKAPAVPTVWAVGLSNLNPNDDFSGITSSTTGEPTIGTNGYARSTSLASGANWNAATTASNDAATIGSNLTAVAFAASTGAWTTTTNTLAFFFVANSTTLQTSAVGISRGSVSPATAVNATGITLSFATGQLALNITPV